MIPMFISGLKDVQQLVALWVGIAFILYGALLLLLWSSDDSKPAKEASKTGLYIIALGILIIIFGLYLLIPMGIVLVLFMVYGLITTINYRIRQIIKEYKE